MVALSFWPPCWREHLYEYEHGKKPDPLGPWLAGHRGQLRVRVLVLHGVTSASGCQCPPPRPPRTPYHELEWVETLSADRYTTPG